MSFSSFRAVASSRRPSITVVLSSLAVARIQEPLFRQAAETVPSGSATGDQIYGTATISGASATIINETIYSGGLIDLYKGAASGITVESGGLLNISGGNTASNTVLSGGGEVELSTSGATLAGTLNFEAGGNTLLITKVLSAAATSGVTIEGFSSTDKIVVSGAT